MRKKPRCVGRVKPRKKYQTNSGLIRYVEVQGDLGTQRCLRSINCPHHRADNARIMELPLKEVGEPQVELTRQQIRALINDGYRKATGKNYYEEAR